MKITDIDLKNIGLVRAVCRELKVDFKKYTCLIETGSYKGDGAFLCSQVFNNVYSIELSKDLYEFCLEKYKNVKNIQFLNGDSCEEIKNIINKIVEKYILFLDAHGSGGDTVYHPKYGRYGTPIIQELEAIKNNIPDIIIIDDYKDYQHLNIFEYCKTNFPEHEYILCKDPKNWVVVLRKNEKQ